MNRVGHVSVTRLGNDWRVLGSVNSFILSDLGFSGCRSLVQMIVASRDSLG